MRALSVLSTLVFLGPACSADIEATEAQLVLNLPSSDECRPPEGLARVEVVAAGDFPSTNDTVEVRSIDELVGMAIRKFPFETRVLTVTYRPDDMLMSDFLAGAVHFRVDEGVQDQLLLLPLGRSCATPDPAVRLLPGGATAPLPDGGYVIAGGQGEDQALRSLLVVPKDESLVERIEALATRRVGATVTRAGARVVIAGGAQGDEFPAEETYEVYDADAGVLDSAVRLMCNPGSMCRRRDHGATALDDGRVLLVGGISRPGGEPMNTAVVIDPRTFEIDESIAPMQNRRRLPFVGTLDDGTVVVAGGLDAAGAFVPSVETFDPSEGTFRVVASIPNRVDAAFVVLPGARLAIVGGRGEREDAVTLLRVRSASEADVTDIAVRGLSPIGSAHAVALADERLLVVGLDDSADAVAFRVDVGRGSADVRSPPARPVTTLVRCDDGAIAEVGAEGASYRRELLRTPFDNPPDTLFSMDAEWLALDAATSYTDGPGGLEGLVDGAPINVAGLTFDGFSVAPTVEGPYRLIFLGQGATRTIEVGDTSVNVDGCEVMRGERDTITFARRGELVEVETDVATRQCSLGAFEGRVRVSLRLDAGSRFRAIAIARL